MLDQIDIDILQSKIQLGEIPEIYYVAHMIETREGVVDEENFKSVSKFKIVKIKISSIHNAYLDKLDYARNPDNYHIEKEEVYYEKKRKYIHNYVVPNMASGSKDINPRIPSVIFGTLIEYLDITTNEASSYHVDMIDPVYSNKILYHGFTDSATNELYNLGKLDWKYITLQEPAIVDGKEFKYITSDWYVLKCDNFPKNEDILINTKRKSAYFMDIDDAFNYKDQLEA